MINSIGRIDKNYENIQKQKFFMIIKLYLNRINGFLELEN